MAIYDSEEPITSEVDIKEFVESIRFHGILENETNDISQAYLAMTGEPKEGLAIDLPIIKGEDGPGVNYKGLIEDFDSLPETGKLGEIWQHATDGAAVIWTEDGWSSPFRWSGERGDDGPRGPKGDEAPPPRYRATLNGRSELGTVSSPQNGDFVVFTSGKGAQYWSGSWGSDFQWVGPRGDTAKGEKGERGPKGEMSKIADAIDFAGPTTAQGFLYKDGDEFRIDSQKIVGAQHGVVTLNDGIFTVRNTRNTAKRVTISTIKAPFDAELVLLPTTFAFDNAVTGGLNTFVTVTNGGMTYAGLSSWGPGSPSGGYHPMLAYGGGGKDNNAGRIYVSKGNTVSIDVTVICYGGNKAMRTRNGRSYIQYFWMRRK